MLRQVLLFIKRHCGFIIFLVALFAFRSSVADWNIVPTGSMKPTILEGDRIWVNKLAYDLHLPFTTIDLLQLNEPERGDIIVFRSPENDVRLVKRVIAIPGDVLHIEDKRVYLNGQPLNYQFFDHPRAEEPIGTTMAVEQLPSIPHRVQWYGPFIGSFGPITVGEGELFVLGDNRDHSRDSRLIGKIPRELILGRTQSVVFSHDYDNYYLPRPGRYFQALDDWNDEGAP